MSTRLLHEVETKSQCQSCEGMTAALTDEQIQEAWLRLGPHWKVVEGGGIKRLRRTFTFCNFQTATAFCHLVNAISELNGHHWNYRVHGWRYVDAEYFTHAISGLSLNDFQCAAAVNDLVGAAADDPDAVLAIHFHAS